jgi:hypothetical protein
MLSQTLIAHISKGRCARACLPSFIVLLFSTSAHSSPPSPKEADLYAGLLGWAVELSGYRQPATPPVVEFVSQEFFNEHACGGRRCRVWGWYPNTGQNVIYVHEAARELVDDSSDPRSLLAASIIVHEFTHYLQAANRGFARYQCAEALELEHEAYAVQNAYLAAYGRYMQIGLSMHNAGCAGSAGQAVVVPSDRQSSDLSQ